MTAKRQTIKTLAKTAQHKNSVIEESNGHIFTEGAALLSQWNEYVNDLYNFQLRKDASVLQSSQTRTSELSTLRKRLGQIQSV